MNQTEKSEVTSNEELQVLLIESKRLHEDRRMWDNNIFRLFSLLLTISSVCLAAVIQVRTRQLPSNVSESFYWEILVIAYPYLIYLFTFIFLVLNGAISHNSAYLKIIEDKINNVVGKPVLIWESQIAQNSFYSARSSYFYATLSIIVFVIVLTIYCIILSLEIFKDTIYYTGYITINTIAAIIILSMLVYTFVFEKKNIYKFLKEKLRSMDAYKKRKQKNNSLSPKEL